VSSFYNSIPGKAVQFGSPLSLLPVWNPGWGNNLKEWGVAIVGKIGGLFGSGATPGTNQLTTLSGTKTVGSAPELATEGTLGAIEKVAPFAMGAATVADIMAHGTCAMMADPAAANAALQSVPWKMARMDQKRKAALLSGITIACGALGFALLMWTPRTGSGILVYVVLLTVLVITAMILFSRKNRDHDS
jgi:hypothetical protein